MRAIVHEKGELKLSVMPDPVPKAGEVVVTLKAAGLNRRDLYIPARRGQAEEPLVLGSDGAGIIEAVGEGVSRFAIGDEVIINPSLCWFHNSDAPPTNFDILGMPDHGTFAEKIVIAEQQLERKPSFLTWEEAAVTALAATTGYRAMFTKGQLQKGQTVFIPGAGSGVATFLIQFARNIGARVIVTSRSEEKRQQALKLGAHVAIDTNEHWPTVLANETIDLVIDSVGAATFNRSLEILKKGGRLVIFGATTDDNTTIDLRNFFYGQYQLLGSTMGSREELRELLQHMEQYKMKPVLDEVFPLERGLDAFQRIEQSEQFGKIAIRMDA